FSEWLTPLSVRIAWLHGGLSAREKKRVQAEIASGEAQIAIGTHALVQKGVGFARLALAVVDEQHRFGVQQRLTLRKKGDDTSPHQLMMSATPIPRTLSMTYFADLDVSVIDVPNASLMVIESAERFGLAQLHQLRGRIGRGARESVCILLYGESLAETARERLKVIYENADGFVIAQRDLEQRGPGEYLGE